MQHRLVPSNDILSPSLLTLSLLAQIRLTELYDRFGDSKYFQAITELLQRNRKAMSTLIETAIPNDPVHFEDWIDDDGKGFGPWKIASTMCKKDGRLMVDFSGTDVQSLSSINFLLGTSMLVSVSIRMKYGLPSTQVQNIHRVLSHRCISSRKCSE